MSTTIDSKVVEMKFDNRNFETNVKTSMSTLDKLKEKLNFKDAEKSLKSLDETASEVNFDDMEKSLDSVSNKFSVWESIAFTAIQRVTNAAIDAGVKMAKSLSIDNIAAGYSKYEQKTSYVQTLLNSTGKELEEVNEYLEKLMWFSDETSFSFTEMTSSLATLMASGADIDKMIPMITGMANATAYAGKSGAEFSRVIMNLSQSYGQGYLNLMDWKSVQLAGVNSKALIDQLIKAGEEMGTLIKITDTYYEKVDGKSAEWYKKNGKEVSQGTFTTTLADKWANTAVLERAFGEFAAASQEAYRRVNMGIADTASEAYEQMKNLPEWKNSLALTAAEAAQAATTWGQVVSSVQDAVGSKWMQIFELIFGDFKEAKTLMTDLANIFYDIFAAPLDDVVNNVSQVMNTPFKKFRKYLGEAGISSVEFADTLKTLYKEINGDDALTKLLNEYETIDAAANAGAVSTDLMTQALQKMGEKTGKTALTVAQVNELIKEIWNGKWGNGTARIEKLNKAGYDGALIQSILNRAWKDGKKSITSFTEAEEKAMAVEPEYAKEVEKLLEDQEALNDLYENFGKKGGRELLTEGITRLIESVSNLLTYIKILKKSIFGDFNWNFIYNMLEKFHNWTFAIALDFEDLETHTPNQRLEKLGIIISNLMKTAKNIASVIKKTVTPVIQAFGVVLDYVGDALEYIIRKVTDYAFVISEWIDKNETLSVIMQNVGTAIISVAKGIKEFVEYVAKSKLAQTIFGTIKSDISEVGNFIAKNVPMWRDTITSFFDALSDNGFLTVAEDIFDNISERLLVAFDNTRKGIATFRERFVDETGKFAASKIPGAFWSIFEDLIMNVTGFYTSLGDFESAFKELSDITDRSLKEVGINFDGLGESVKNAGDAISKFISKIDLGDLAAVFITFFSLSKTVGLIKTLDWMNKATANFGMVINTINNVVNETKKTIASLRLLVYGGLLIEFSIAVGIIAAALVAITKLIGDEGELGKFMVVTGLMTAAIIAIGYVFSSLSSVAKNVGSVDSKVFLSFAAIFGAIGLMLAGFAYAISVLQTARLSATTVVMFLGILTIIGAVMYACMKLSKQDTTKFNANGYLGMFASMLIIVMAIKMLTRTITKLSKVDNVAGVMVALGLIILAMSGIMTVLTSVTKAKAANAKTSASALIFVAGALLLVAIAIDKLNKIKVDNPGELFAKIVAAIGSLIAVMMIMSKNSASLAGISAIGVSIYALAKAMQIISRLSDDEIIRSGFIILAVFAVIAIMAKVLNGTDLTKLTPSFTSKGTLSKLAGLVGVAVIILSIAGAMIAISMIPIDKMMHAAIALGLVISATAVLVKTAQGIGSDAKNAVASASQLVAISMMISSIATAVTLLGGKDSAVLIKGCLAMAVVMAGVAGVLIATSKLVGAGRGIGTKQLISMIVLLAGIAAIIGIVAYTINNNSPDGLIKGAAAFGIIFAAITVMIIGLAAASQMITSVGPQALLGLAVMSVLLILLGAIVAQCMDIGKHSNELKEFMISMVEFFVAFAALGGFIATAAGVGSLVIGFAGPIAAGLGAFAAVIALIAELGKISDPNTIQAGIDIVGIIFEGIGSAIGRFLGGLVGGVALGFMDNFLQIGQTLESFAEGSTKIMDLAEQIGNDKKKKVGLDNIIELISSMSDLAKVADSVATIKFTGDGSIGSSMVDFASCMKDMMDEIDAAGIDITKLDKVADAASKLSSVIETLAPSGDALYNSYDIKQYSETLKTAVGEMLTIYKYITDESSEYGFEYSDDHQKKLEQFIAILTTLSEAGSNMPTGFGGVDAFLHGDMEDFAKNLGEFYKALTDNKKGLLSLIVGFKKPDNLDEFLDMTDSFLAIGERFKGFKDIVNKTGGGQFGNFNQQLGFLGSYMQAFNNNVANVDQENVKNAMGALDIIFTSLTKFGSDETLEQNIESLSNVMKTLAETGIDSFVDFFSSTEFNQKIDDVAIEFEQSLANAMNEQDKGITNTFHDAILGPISGANKEYLYNEMFNMGKYLVDGLAGGIDRNSSTAETAMNDLVGKLVKTYRTLTGTESPSKLFMEFGGYLDEGLALGMEKNGSRVINASGSLAEYATTGIKNAIDSISYLIDRDVDTTPTITPILDLSEIQNGASTIGGLLNNSYSLASKAGYGFNTNAIGAAGYSTSNNNTTINMTVNGAANQNVDDLANSIVQRLNNQINRRTKVWR